MIHYLIQLLKGIMIGIANIVPGVSGGTLAVSMGVYDIIIKAVTGFRKHFLQSIKTLLPYGIGAGIGIVGLSFAIEPLFQYYPFQTSMAFIGLILGGLPIIFQKIRHEKLGVSHATVFVLFFAFIVGLQIVGGGSGKEVVLSIGPAMICKLFFVGVIASATMVIPGVSGSMILMLLGYYTPIIEQINDFVLAVTQGDWAACLHGAGILVPFGIGVVIGIFAIAKLIEILLDKWKTHTFSGIFGLVLASPVVILMQLEQIRVPIGTLLTGILSLAIGGVIAYFLGGERE